MTKKIIRKDKIIYITKENHIICTNVGEPSSHPIVVITDNEEIPLFLLFVSKPANGLSDYERASIYNICFSHNEMFRDYFKEQTWKPLFLESGQLIAEKALVNNSPRIGILDVPAYDGPDGVYPYCFYIKKGR